MPVRAEAGPSLISTSIGGARGSVGLAPGRSAIGGAPPGRAPNSFESSFRTFSFNTPSGNLSFTKIIGRSESTPKPVIPNIFKDTVPLSPGRPQSFDRVIGREALNFQRLVKAPSINRTEPKFFKIGPVTRFENSPLTFPEYRIGSLRLINSPIKSPTSLERVGNMAIIAKATKGLNQEPGNSKEVKIPTPKPLEKPTSLPNPKIPEYTKQFVEKRVVTDIQRGLKHYKGEESFTASLQKALDTIEAIRIQEARRTQAFSIIKKDEPQKVDNRKKTDISTAIKSEPQPEAEPAKSNKLNPNPQFEPQPQIVVKTDLEAKQGVLEEEITLLEAQIVEEVSRVNRLKQGEKTKYAKSGSSVEELGEAVIQIDRKAYDARLTEALKVIAEYVEEGEGGDLVVDPEKVAKAIPLSKESLISRLVSQVKRTQKDGSLTKFIQELANLAKYGKLSLKEAPVKIAKINDQHAPVEAVKSPTDRIATQSEIKKVLEGGGEARDQISSALGELRNRLESIKAQKARVAGLTDSPDSYTIPDTLTSS